MTKTQNKEEILNNQKIVANSISNINNQQLEKKVRFLTIHLKKIKHQLTNDNLKISRGWFDFKAINIRFTKNEVFNKFFPKNEKQQKLYKILNYSRSIYLGFCEYKGCRINIKKYFDQLSLLFEFELKKKRNIIQIAS